MSLLKKQNQLFFRLFLIGILSFLFMGAEEDQRRKITVEKFATGVWKVSIGKPEEFTPNKIREKSPDIEGLKSLSSTDTPPFDLNQIRMRVTDSRTTVGIPCREPGESIYGFGLDANSFDQKGLRKQLMVCSSTLNKVGFSHAPSPFYISTKGYGVYVDTARVSTVHVAYKNPKVLAVSDDGNVEELKTTVEELYAIRKAEGDTEVIFEMTGNNKGVDVFVFEGPTALLAVQRYVLFSGGGAVPPLWGLGMKYRTYTQADQATVEKVMRSIRKFKIPCDMMGLEPGWQTAAYSNSLVWSKERYPDHEGLIQRMKENHIRLSLWEHAFIHPTSPLYPQFEKKSADFFVFNKGIVPDFADPEVFKIYGDYHRKEFVDQGIYAFKADECDNEPLQAEAPWNLPYSAYFPSKIDGEIMSQTLGYWYQRSLFRVFSDKNQRTWGEVRASSALSAPLPFNLYSDTYGFDEYLRQTVNAGFTGVLWSPEVRNAGSLEELSNRIALSSMSHHMCLDIWYMPLALWEQYDHAKNVAGISLPENEQIKVAEKIKAITEFRYQLIPYLYSAFHRYYREGIPPIRALVLDYPSDLKVRKIDDEYMLGDSLLVAPLKGTSGSRSVYLPVGNRWIDFHTNKSYEGGVEVKVALSPGDVPLFVKENTLLPLADPVQFINQETLFKLNVKVYGDKPLPFRLIEDQGETFDFEKGEFNNITLLYEDGNGKSLSEGKYKGVKRYEVGGWEKITVK